MKNKNTFKKYKHKIFVFISLFLVFCISASVSASSLHDKQKQLEGEIGERKELLDGKKAEVKTLNSEVAAIDQNLDAINAKIRKTNNEIKNLEETINALIVDINAKEEEVKSEQENLKRTIRLLYEKGELTTFEVLASSGSVTSFLSQEEYTRAIQDKINETIAKIKGLKIELIQKRNEQEVKKQEQINLKNILEGERASLNSAISSKNELLLKTKGEESNYQKLLQEAINAKKAVDKEIADLSRRNSFGPYVGGGSVKRGNVIGYQGNTGFSTGSHLHFGLYKNGEDIDPMPHFNSGFLSWPLSSFTITQGYWGTFSHRGAGWPGGVDFVQYYGAPVMAAQDGDIIKKAYSGSGFGNYVVIDHNNGYLTLYAHLK